MPRLCGPPVTSSSRSLPGWPHGRSAPETRSWFAGQPPSPRRLRVESRSGVARLARGARAHLPNRSVPVGCLGLGGFRRSRLLTRYLPAPSNLPRRQPRLPHGRVPMGSKLYVGPARAARSWRGALTPRPAIAEQGPARLVLDVRHNNGGNGALLPPVMRVLREFERRPGEIVVLMGGTPSRLHRSSLRKSTATRRPCSRASPRARARTS